MKLSHMIALLAFASTIIAAQPAEAMRPLPSTQVYPTKAEDIKDTQQVLYANGCYGNQLDIDQNDGKFGDLSRRALWVFADTVKLKYKNLKSINISDKKYRFQDFKFLLTLPDLDPEFCKLFGQSFLKKWYDDKDFHIPGKGRSDDKMACNKDVVAQNYLHSITSGKDEDGNDRSDLILATRLHRPLSSVVKEFGRIFVEKDLVDPEKDVAILNNNETALGLYRDHAEKVDEYNDIVDTLKLAKKQFYNLALRYGLKQKAACNVCVQINDWLFLRNIAQANGGNLIYDDGKGKISIVHVNTITKKMLLSVRGNIFLHQRMGVKWDRLVKLSQEDTSDPGDTPREAELKRTAKQNILKEIYVIKKQRSDLLHNLARGLHKPLNKSDKVEVKNTNDLMTTLEEEYDCLGFDGSPLY